MDLRCRVREWEVWRDTRGSDLHPWENSWAIPDLRDCDGEADVGERGLFWTCWAGAGFAAYCIAEQPGYLNDGGSWRALHRGWYEVLSEC